MQQIVDPVPLPTLDDPAPQMVGQLLNLAHFLGTPLPDPEQVIEVPKILSDDVPMRNPLREPQLAEQLVEVPTIVSWSLLQLITKHVRGVSWSEVATVPKRKSHRGLDLDLSLNTEKNIWKGWKENGGTK